MRRINVLKWDKYAKLTILKESKQMWQYRMFKCKCECWNIIIAALSNMRSKNTSSCWCISKSIPHNQSHKLSKTRIYRTYYGILARCYNKRNKSYKYYWNRWIKCLWKTFEEFYEDMKEWHQDHLTIDRIDNDWNYCKSNCRWATKKEQNRNTRRNHYYKWKCISQWCEELWLNPARVITKLHRWTSYEKALGL